MRTGYPFILALSQSGQISMNLLPIYEALKKGMLSKNLVDKLVTRAQVASAIVSRIQSASGAKYPYWFASPYVLIMDDSAQMQQAILYSRLVPIIADDGKLNITIEITGPLLLYASKDTLLAAMAHEFSHYVDFSQRINDFRVQTAETSYTIHESLYTDEEALFDPSKIFGRHRSIIKSIDKKFQNGLSDDALNKKTLSLWISKSLPVKRIVPEDNNTDLPVRALMEYKIPEDVLKLIGNVKKK